MSLKNCSSVSVEMLNRALILRDVILHELIMSRYDDVTPILFQNTVNILSRWVMLHVFDEMNE